MAKAGRPRTEIITSDKRRIAVLFFAAQIGLSWTEFQKIADKKTTDEEARSILDAHSNECWNLICKFFNDFKTER